MFRNVVLGPTNMITWDESMNLKISHLVWQQGVAHKHKSCVSVQGAGNSTAKYWTVLWKNNIDSLCLCIMSNVLREILLVGYIIIIFTFQW
jgi:hypothetical protein